MSDRYDSIKLDNQLCFPLYAYSKEVIRAYKPILEEFDLTYTQYICLMALWEHGKMSVKDLGSLLYLDSGTLTPVLKKLEAKGYIERRRNREDERILDVSLTGLGLDLREKALSIPPKMVCALNLSDDEIEELKRLVNKAIGRMQK